MRGMSRWAATALAGVAVSVVAGVALAGAAMAESTNDGPTPDNGGSIVEDYSYPGAAGILATDKVKLVSGDGHILYYADCAHPPTGDVGLIEVHSTEPVGHAGDGFVCFKVLGNKGLLTLELPAVYEIRGDGRKKGTGHNITATVKTDSGQSTSVKVDPSGSTQVGIGTNPPGDPTMLVELKVVP